MVLQDLHAMVAADLDRMLAAFVRLDREERAARLLMGDYATYLPERVRATTLVERHQQLQEQVTALNLDYLQLADAYPPPDELRPPRLQEAGSSYRKMAIRLEEMADRVSAMLETAMPELRKVGAAKITVEQRQQDVRRDLAAADAAMAELAAAGLTCTAADLALDEARRAAEAVRTWAPGGPLEALDEAARRVHDAAGEAVRTAKAYPEQVAGVPQRAKTLRTRLDSLQTRAAAIPHDLGELRRSYRSDDWIDLDRCEREATRLLADARGVCDELDAAVTQRRFDDATVLTDTAKSALDEVAEVVDGPRRRLERLDEVRADPQAVVGRARFAVRDAQMMVQAGPPARLADFAPELDRLSARVEAARSAVEAGRPSWWATLRELDRIRDEVAALVTRYRLATRA